MDKKTFIRELRQALSVLQEDELNDIINEYEQHIDMKMKNGLTEDEAIADFGSLPELTADILEAYHVRADYAEEHRNKKKSFFGDEGRAAGREFLQRTEKGCRAARIKASGALQWFGKWIWGILLFWKKQLGKPFSFLRQMWKNRQNCGAVGDEDMESIKDAAEMEPDGSVETTSDRVDISEKKEIAERRSGKRVISGIWELAGKVIHSFFHFSASCICFGWKLALWGFRAAWNICCAGTSLLCAGIGLLCLYILGLLVVLWMQHYPLAGVTIGFLGLVLCAFSAAGFCLTLLWRKRNRRPTDTDDPAGQNSRRSQMQEKKQEQVENQNTEETFLMEKGNSLIWCQEMKGGQHA